MNASMLDCVTINIMIHGTVVVKPYMALSKNKSQKSQNLELKLKGLNMTVAELYGANNTPYDEVLIKFKDEGLDENDPRKDTDELEDIYLDLEVKSFWFESVIERRKEKVTKFFVIVIK